MTTKTADSFERWWNDEGSGMCPKPDEDREQHMKRIAEIAWSNGAYIAEVSIASAIRTRADNMTDQASRPSFEVEMLREIADDIEKMREGQ